MIVRNRLAATVALSLVAAGCSALAAPLDVRIDGVEARGHAVFVSVQTEAQFLTDASVASQRISEPQDETLRVRFDVPPGVYAVIVWHDDDGNGEFDTGMFGRPRDGWAMSGLVRGRPTFEKIKLTVPRSGVEAALSMTYPRP